MTYTLRAQLTCKIGQESPDDLTNKLPSARAIALQGNIPVTGEQELVAICDNHPLLFE